MFGKSKELKLEDLMRVHQPAIEAGQYDGLPEEVIFELAYQRNIRIITADCPELFPIADVQSMIQATEMEGFSIDKEWVSKIPDFFGGRSETMASVYDILFARCMYQLYVKALRREIDIIFGCRIMNGPADPVAKTYFMTISGTPAILKKDIK